MLSWWWAGPPAWTSPAPPSGAPPLATLQLAADETYQNGYFRQPAGLVLHNYKVREVALKLIFEMTPLYGVVLWKIKFEPTDCAIKHFLKRNTRNSLYCILHIIASLMMFQLTSRWSKWPVWHSPDSCKPSSRQNPADHLPPARSAPWTSHVPCIVHGEEAFSTCLTWLCSPRIWFWCLGTLSHQRPHHHSEE